MTPKQTQGSTFLTDRRLFILAGIVWGTAVVMAGLYLWVAFGAPPAPLSAQTPTPVITGATTAHTGASPTSSLTTSTTIPPSSSTTSTISSTTTSTTEPPPPPLTVAAGGDVLGDRQVGTFIDHNGGEAVLANVEPFMDEASIAFVNLECPLSDKGTRKVAKEYTFRGRPALAQGLMSAGIDVVSLANNHTLDYGPAALLDTIARLDDAGVAHAGAGADAAAAQAPALLISPAGVVAVLAFTEIIPGGFSATGKQPGVNATTPDREKLLAAIASAKKKADFVIVSFHWGTEYTERANEDQRRLAHQAIDAGADLVLGHHPHVIQGLELYHDKLIAYSLGDFVFDHYSRKTGEAFVLQVTMTREGAPSLEVVPVYLSDSTGVPAPVTGEEADTILTRLTRLSADLGLELTRLGDRALYQGPKALIP
jgi:poly-gamma-glutamate capsule biosynthesis protein CapA/YwtB (metallophosphatase superfamily)